METTKFDTADFLDSNEMIAEYLNSVLEEGNYPEIIVAIKNIATAVEQININPIST